MKLEKVAAIAEVVSSIAVLVTLIYLSVQTRQNTEALLAVSRQATLQGEMTALSTLVTYPVDFPSADDADWSAEQELRFEALLIQTLRVREFAWFQYRGGTLDEATWQSYLRPLAGIFASARARRLLDKYYGDPKFKAYLADWLSSAAKQ